MYQNIALFFDMIFINILNLFCSLLDDECSTSININLRQWLWSRRKD